MEKQQENSGRFPTDTGIIRWFLKGSLRFFVMSAVFACLAAVMELLSPKIIEFTVDSIIGDLPSKLPSFLQEMFERLGGRPFLRENPVIIGLAVMAAAAAGALFRYAFRICNAKGAETMMKRMRDSLFEQLLQLPMRWYGENHTGDILQRCTSDVERIKVFVSEQLTTLLRTVLLIGLSVFFMAGINLRLALAAALFIPVMIGMSIVFYHRIGSSFEEVDEKEARVSGVVQENLTGVRVVRAFGREQYERTRFEAVNEDYTGMWIRLMAILSAYWVLGDVLSTVRTLTVIVLGAVFCVNGTLTAGGLIAFLSYNTMITMPLRQIGRTISEMSQAGVSAGRIRVIMNAEPERDEPDSVEMPLHGDIVFDHVTFSYGDGSAPVLSDVSFRVREGKTTGILGATGSGKSTLMYLLNRLYELPADGSGGTITIGGTDIRKIRRASLRGNIGMVLQEPYLFSGTLEENLRIAEQDADDDHLMNAVETACLRDTIERFSAGFETRVGERGVTLSGGQKQRTAIAQTLLRETPVTVFDDSLSAVDSRTDAQIRESLARQGEGRTRILIAHRITTLMQADEIIVLEKGRVVQKGNHEQLLKEDGPYRMIYNLQMSREFPREVCG